MEILSKLIVLLLFLAQLKAEIRSVNIRLDKRREITFDKFKFTHGGQVYISLSAVSFTSDPARLGFYMVPHESQQALLYKNPKHCILDSDLITPLFTFRDLSADAQISYHYNVTYPEDFTVYFANCNPKPVVTMDIHIELYNMVDGHAKDYLSLGLKPYHYTIFLVIYGVFLVIWVIICFKNRQKPYFCTIHILMAGLLALAFLEMMFAVIEKKSVKATGTPQGWGVYYDISQLFRDELFFMVIVLLGLGWSYLRSPQRKEKIFLVSVLILRCPANLASIQMRRAGPSDSNWDTWKTWYFRMHLISWALSYVAPLRTVIWIRKAADASGKKFLLKKKFLFLSYVFMFYVYFVVKVMVMVAIKHREDKEQYMTGPVFCSIDEIVSLVLYVILFYTVRPVQNNVIFDHGKNFQQKSKRVMYAGPDPGIKNLHRCCGG